MRPKLDYVRDAMRAGNWPLAIQLAAKFPELGAAKADILKAREAILRPDFQRQIGRCPAQLIEAGKAALIGRYGNG